MLSSLGCFLYLNLRFFRKQKNKKTSAAHFKETLKLSLKMTQHTNFHVKECVHVSGAGKENPAFHHPSIHPSVFYPIFPDVLTWGGGGGRGSPGYTLSLLQHQQMRATSIHMRADTGRTRQRPPFRARDVESRLTGNLVDVPDPQDP